MLKQYGKHFNLTFKTEKAKILKTRKHRGPRIIEAIRLVDTIRILGTEVGYNSKDYQVQKLKDILLSLRRELHV